MTYVGRCDTTGCSWHLASGFPGLITELFGNHFAKAHAGLTGGLGIKPVPPEIQIANPGARIVDNELLVNWPPKSEQLVQMGVYEPPEATDVRLAKQLSRMSTWSVGITLGILLVAIAMVTNRGWAPFLALPGPAGNVATVVWLAALATLVVLSAVGDRFMSRLPTASAHTALVLAPEIVASTIAVLLAALLTLAILGVADMGTPGAGQILPTSFVDLFFLELLLSYAGAATLIASTVLFVRRRATLKALASRQ